MRVHKTQSVALLLAALVGCSPGTIGPPGSSGDASLEGGGSDAGLRDTTPTDSGMRDAVTTDVADAARMDSGMADAVTTDAADVAMTMTPDAVVTDAAPADVAGTDAPTGPIFYVATTGNDANDGSINNPWRTISHAMRTVPAGATVMVRAGVYSEQVDVNVSGMPGAPITLQSYPGETGIIDGTSVPVVDGAGLININAQSHLVVSGLEIRNWTSNTSAVPAGIFVQGAATDVQILDNHVHDIVTTVESCNGAGGNAFGVAVYGNATTPISALVIHGNELNNLRTGCSESLTINGNVDGFEVSGNLVHDNDNIGIDAIGYEGTAPSTALDMARNGAIRQNTVYNITGQMNPAYGGSLGADGLYVDGGQDLVIEQNLVHNVDLGIEIASEHSGRDASYVVARNNVVYYSNLAGASVGGYDSSVGGTDHCAFVNNTLYDDAVELAVQFHVSAVLFEDNLVYSSTGSFTCGSPSGVTSDHDLELQTGASTVFMNPGTPTNGAVAVDLQTTPSESAQVVNQGIAVACPSGWTCPTIWGSSLNGSSDVAGNPRPSASGGVDIGAYQSQ